MFSMISMTRRGCCLLAGAALLCLPSAVNAEESRSADAVKQLTSLMAERQLDAMAAPDPANPGQFVAALLIPGVQLLVVAAQYPAPQDLQSLLAQRNYHDVYTALHQPVTLQSRLFFVDAGCDGLHTGTDLVDVMYEKGVTQTLFDGDWKKGGLSESAYMKKVQDSDAGYSRLVTLLLDGLKTPAAGSSE
jgi:hypothetical protein